MQNPQTRGQHPVELLSKNPALFDGSSSCFQYEELIDDWMNLTQCEAGKRGPALMKRLAGDASMHKELLDRKDGVKCYRDTLLPLCVSALLNQSSWGLAKNVVSTGNRTVVASGSTQVPDQGHWCAKGVSTGKESCTRQASTQSLSSSR